jgi:hygromycin-B 7''-O-kinase
MRLMLPDLTRLDMRDAYVGLFADAAFWRPVVTEICRRHSLAPCETIYAGHPGTYPTFIVEDRWVVKLFGRLFNGAAAYETECEVARILGHAPSLPMLLIADSLHNGCDWPWPYLIYKYLPGIAIGEVYERVRPDDRLALARWVGEIVRRVHAAPLDDSQLFPPTWVAYLARLREQREGCAARHAGWGNLPPHLIGQIDAYLPPVETLIERPRPHLIHADLTDDHILGCWENGRWTTSGLIDFGDAMVGELGYELAALQLDLFRGDRAMLAAFLDAYGLDAAARADLPRRALCCALLHRFNVFDGLAEILSGLNDIATLDELAAHLWGQEG